MICPYCNTELVAWDYFGRIADHQDGTVLGDIYKCPNDLCDSYSCNHTFYAYRTNPDHLYEGMPC